VAQKNIFFNVSRVKFRRRNSFGQRLALSKAISSSKLRKNSAPILGVTSCHEPYPKKICFFEPLRVLMTHEDIKTNLPILKIVKYY
jgi:hypothetical protein